MSQEKLFKKHAISITDSDLVVDGHTFKLEQLESILIAERNPAKERAMALFAIGLVLVLLTSRWFMAGGVFSILVAIVSLFDSKWEYCLIIKTTSTKQAVLKLWDLKEIKQLKEALTVELRLKEK